MVGVPAGTYTVPPPSQKVVLDSTAVTVLIMAKCISERERRAEERTRVPAGCSVLPSPSQGRHRIRTGLNFLFFLFPYHTNNKIFVTGQVKMTKE